MIDEIPEDFLLDIYKCCIENRNVFEVVRQHLQPNFIADVNYKKIWKEINNQYKLSNNGKKITIGGLKLSLRNDVSLRDILSDVIDIQIDDYQVVLNNFETFIKEKKFVELFQETGLLYNRGKVEESYELFRKGSEDFNNFSIKNSYYEKIYEDYDKRTMERTTNSDHREKIPSGFDELDLYTYGGFEKGDAVLWVGDSGVGKSQLMIQLAINASRRGFKVAHFQAEGTRKQCLDRYDAAWTGTLYNDMKSGILDQDKYKRCMKVIEKMGRGEIYTECFEKFGSKSILDVRSSIIEMNKLYGQIDMVVLDYLELVDPGDGMKYNPESEKARQQKVSRSIKDIAVELNVLFHTPTQASSVDTKDLNDADFVLTRYNLSADKGKLQPFDGLISINQTRDEQRVGMARLFNDKLREHKSGQTMQIVQNLSRSRFYDRKATLDVLAEQGLLVDEE